MFNPSFIWYALKELFTKKEKVKPAPKEYTITDVTTSLPWNPLRKWGKRPTSKIKQVVVHQALSTGSVSAINNYHITPGPDNHLSKEGAPHIAYHYAIDRQGQILQCNALTDLVWHTKNQNTKSVGVLVAGDFDYNNNTGKDGEPTKDQMDALEFLLTHLEIKLNLTAADIYGHKDFGKPACPGNTLYNYIQQRKGEA